MRPSGWLAVSVLLTAGACASSGAVPRPFPVPGSGPRPLPAPAPAVIPAVPGDPITATALALQGTPYRNGGTDPSGFDCSGFVQYVFARHGLALPREVRDQYEAGSTVPRTGIQAGDLLFFTTVSPGPSHVAIAIDGARFVHAPSSRGVVRVESLDSSYWRGRFLTALRIIQ